MDDLYDHYLDLDNAFDFARNARRPMTHITPRATTTTLCGQDTRRVGNILTDRRRYHASIICRRCQASYWRRYEEAQKNL